MVLVDSSVLIQYLRTRSAKLRGLFASEPTAICGVMRTELLRGARGRADRRKTLTFLNRFAQVEIPDALWDVVGDNLALLRSQGVTVPFQDAVIATLAVNEGYELWAYDAHFALMQTVLPGLRLFAEPP